MKITKITQQVKNTERVNIFVDGKYSFSLTLDQLLDLKIKADEEIDEAELIRLKKLSQDGKLKMRALEWLMIRPHSAKELGDYLRRKNLDQETIKDWSEEFQNKHYQNDESFARWWIEQRQGKGRSSAFIKHELKAKGIADEITNKLLESSGLTDKEILKKLIAKKKLQAKYQDNKKLAEYLVRLGFRYSLIKEVLAE
jgi:regulatory protein